MNAFAQDDIVIIIGTPGLAGALCAGRRLFLDEVVWLKGRLRRLTGGGTLLRFVLQPRFRIAAQAMSFTGAVNRVSTVPCQEVEPLILITMAGIKVIIRPYGLLDDMVVEIPGRARSVRFRADN